MKAHSFILLASFLFFSGCASLFSKRSCDVTKAEYGDLEFSVHVSIYADAKASDKSIIIIPPTGGTNYIDKSYADQLCYAGYDVLIMDRWSNMNTDAYDIHIHDALYARGQEAIKIVLSHIDSRYVGLLGTSLGGLHSSVAASVQERINSVFIIVAGAPISDIIATSDQDAMIKLREKRKVAYGFKDAVEHAAAIVKVFRFEPMRISEMYKTKDLGMSIALQDTTVPTRYQTRLKDFWKPKVVINNNSSHFWGIVKTWLFDSSTIQKFFDDSSTKFLASQTK